MNSAALIRHAVESALARRIPSALSPQPKTVRERLVCEVEELDRLLGGGLPVGAVTELVGITGSGRTTLALAYAAAVVRDGRVVSWVDAGDTLDPGSAALNGVELSRLLWVRCKAESEPRPGPMPSVRPVAFATESQPAVVKGCGSPHPRNEVKGMPEAVNAMLQAHGGLLDHQTRRERKAIGTPGMPNRTFTRSADREEQRPSDRQPTRKERSLAHEPRCAESQPHRRKTDEAKVLPARVMQVASTRAFVKKRSDPPWSALDNALRATDLLLQSGGFGLIVLDLGDVPAEQSWRIPMAMWFRYRAACERSRTSLLVLTQHPCARSSAELVVRMGMGDLESQGNVLTGVSFQAEIERQRFAEQPTNVVSIRKPPKSEQAGLWKGRMSWAV
jgi:recombination protein RecA